jgi:hypothetical protein
LSKGKLILTLKGLLRNPKLEEEKYAISETEIRGDKTI